MQEKLNLWDLFLGNWPSSPAAALKPSPKRAEMAELTRSASEKAETRGVQRVNSPANLSTYPLLLLISTKRAEMQELTRSASEKADTRVVPNDLI